MSEKNFSIKAKELRNRKGFSQEQLAEESKLSLRTIQRIEHGESIPRGDTLIRLSHALGVSPYDLLDWIKVDDTGYLAVLNLSATSVIIHPVLGVIIPTVLWMLKREKVNLADDTGKKIINFQITMALSLYIIGVVLSMIIGEPGTLPIDGNLRIIEVYNALTIRFHLTGFVIILLSAYNLLLVFINTVRSQKGLKCWYLPAIQFLK